MNYFSSIEQVCDLCKRQRVHMFESEIKHETCICMLLTFSSLCCYDGFVNLLKNEPSLIKFIKEVPYCNNVTRMLYISYHKPLINTMGEELREKCSEYMNKMTKHDNMNSFFSNVN